jgi:hypothetical protein
VGAALRGPRRRRLLGTLHLALYRLDATDAGIVREVF